MAQNGDYDSDGDEHDYGDSDYEDDDNDGKPAKCHPMVDVPNVGQRLLSAWITHLGHHPLHHQCHHPLRLHCQHHHCHHFFTIVVNIVNINMNINVLPGSLEAHVQESLSPESVIFK